MHIKMKPWSGKERLYFYRRSQQLSGQTGQITDMRVSYNKLRHLLIDRNMTKRALEKKAGITHYQMYKIGRNKDLNTSILRAICVALNCDPGDIIEFIRD